MRKITVLLLFFAGVCSAALAQKNEPLMFRPPSVPLVTHDPYFSIWSPADRLTDMETVHWTGARNPLHSMLRVDGKTYRLMGASPSYAEPMKQTGLMVLPTTTTYEFGNGSVKVSMIFTSPLLAGDIEALSRPVTYVTWKVEAADGKSHDIELYFDCGSELAVNTNEQSVSWEQPAINGLRAGKIGNPEQKYLNRSGDNIRIDWGYAWLAVPGSQNPAFSVATRKALLDGFAREGKLPETLASAEPVRVRDGSVSMAAMWNLGKTGQAPLSAWAMVAYD
nr:DUF5127 domain-containing protein [Bacteroidales bacterium]